MTEQSTPYLVTTSAEADIRTTIADLADALIRAVDLAFGEIASLRADLDRLQQVERGRVWMNRSEAADYLRISVDKLDMLRGDGRLVSHNVDARPLFHVSDLDALVRRQDAA